MEKEVGQMILYKKEEDKKTLYGIGMLVGFIVRLNNFFILKIFDVSSKRELYFINFLNFLLFVFEVNIGFLCFSGFDNIYEIFLGTIWAIILVFYFALDELPYWRDSGDPN